MPLSKIKKDRWYETIQGVGICRQVGGTHPPSVRIDIRAPFPRGEVYLSPREVIRELREYEIPRSSGPSV